LSRFAWLQPLQSLQPEGWPFPTYSLHYQQFGVEDRFLFSCNRLWCDYSSLDRKYGLSAVHPLMLEFVVFELLFRTILIDFTMMF
jgi:hypothetical protein